MGDVSWGGAPPHEVFRGTPDRRLVYAADGDVRLFLQGLIQVAAGYHKATVQLQPNGCVKLLRSGLDKLELLPPEFLGVALGRFVPEVVRTLEQARRWQSGDLSSFPQEMIPKLRL